MSGEYKTIMDQYFEEDYTSDQEIKVQTAYDPEYEKYYNGE